MFLAAHHDGSELYVSDPAPDIGATVDLFVRVPDELGVRAVHVRSTPDAEPYFDEAIIDRTADGETWWRAPMRVTNPDNHYRFLLDQGRRGYAWLNATGTHDADLPDDADYRLTTYRGAPGWTTGSVVYEIFPDRFASSGGHRDLPDWAIPADWYADPVIPWGPLTERQIYGGDFAGIQQHLDHIEALGADTVYLTPFFTATSAHRYDAQNFTDVDPLLGGNGALVALAEQLHRRGLRLIGDLTTNHTGYRHDWFLTGRGDPASPEAGFYYWNDHEPGYDSWLDVSSLPKLNWGSDELRRRMFGGDDSIVSRWLRPPYNLDGWRIDVANMTGRHHRDNHSGAVARGVRTAVATARPDALLLAEYGQDYTRDLTGETWHGSMNYAGFTRPMWRWLVDPGTDLSFLGMPVPVRRASGPNVVATMTDFLARVPWPVRLANLNQLGSHDTARIRTVTGDPRLVEVGAALLMTLPGIPAVFAGDEIGMEGVNGEDARRPFPWKAPEQWDERTFDAYRRLIRLRRGSPALQRGGLRWVRVDDDTLVFLRETARERVLVAATRSGGPGGSLPPWIRAGGAEEIEVLYGAPPRVGPNGLRLPGDGPGAHVWRLP